MILERERKKFQTTAMAKACDRSSKPLHNFSLPRLKWGNQRFLRCMKLSPNTSNSSSSLIPTSVISFQNAETDANGGIEAIHQKLMLDLREAADKMRHSILEDDSERPCWILDRMSGCSISIFLCIGDSWNGKMLWTYLEIGWKTCVFIQIFRLMVIIDEYN